MLADPPTPPARPTAVTPPAPAARARPNVVDWVCTFLLVGAGGAAIFELTVALSAVRSSTRAGGIIGCAWFGSVAVLCAAVLVVRAVGRAQRNALPSPR